MAEDDRAVQIATLKKDVPLSEWSVEELSLLSHLSEVRAEMERRWIQERFGFKED